MFSIPWGLVWIGVGLLLWVIARRYLWWPAQNPRTEYEKRIAAWGSPKQQAELKRRRAVWSRKETDR